MEGLNRITFFKSYWDAEQQMHTQRDKLSFLEGILAYSFEGRLPEMTPSASAAFILVQPYLDKSITKAANGKLGGSRTRTAEPETGSKEEANGKQGPSNKKEEGRKKNLEEKKGEETKKSAPPLLTLGEYKWIRLSQEQLDRLLADLGEAELKRCIQVVDEAVQKNGNKYGYRDWNLVLRKAHREGWGLRERRDGYGNGNLSRESAKPESDGSIQYD